METVAVQLPAVSQKMRPWSTCSLHALAYATTHNALLEKWKAVTNPTVAVLTNTALILYILFSLTRTWCYSIQRERQS